MASWRVTNSRSYRSEAPPPIANANMMLSISNPVVDARLNRDGGDQYAGTKIGSVRPRSDVHKLTISSTCFFSFVSSIAYITTQMPSSIRLHVNQAYCIVMYESHYVYRPPGCFPARA